MKKIIVVIIAIALFVGFIAVYNEIHKYEKRVEVIRVANDLISVRDNLGNEWQFTSKGFKVGNTITVVFEGNETPQIYDDKIIGMA